MDRNQDGILSELDFDLIAQRASENQDKSREGELHKRIIAASTQKYFQRLVEAVELEGDHIDLRQWLDFFNRLSKEEEQETEAVVQFFLEFFFGVFDVNKDGFISLYEYMELFQIFGLPVSKTKEAFNQVDANADGQISRYELMDAIEVYLTSDDKTEKGNLVFGQWR
ncbi:MAG: EF-hand domain-containing protein [Marinoscillum sp.]